MISTYIIENNIIKKTLNCTLNESTVWIDLLNIDNKEEQIIEDFLGIDIPTNQEISQIEVSRRLYVENNAFYITTTLISNNLEFPDNDYVLFILHANILITIRYTEVKAFNVFIKALDNPLTKYSKDHMLCSANAIFLKLLSNIIERMADVIEYVNESLDHHNQLILSNSIDVKKNIQYNNILYQIGNNGQILSKGRQSLVSLNRAINYALKIPMFCKNDEYSNILNTLQLDIASISDFAQFVSQDLMFLLDATLGMIAIEQNNISKKFSVLAVLFFPPTLIASIYGMNFENMPELTFKYGYPTAIACMIAFTLFALKLLKHKKWL